MSSIEGIELYASQEENPETISEFVSHELIMKQVDQIYEHMSQAIGHGKSAEVVHIPEYKASICYKIIAETRLEELYDSTSDIPKFNSPKVEAYFLSQVEGLHRRVRTPKPLCFWEGNSDALGHFKILVLERLDAFTVQDLLFNQSTLNPDFDINQFSEDLTNFVTKMNEQGIHHNDITVTNIMIDRETNAPCVIDFGDSEKEFGIEKKPFTKDKVAVRDVINLIKNHLQHSVSIDN